MYAKSTHRSPRKRMRSLTDSIRKVHSQHNFANVALFVDDKWICWCTIRQRPRHQGNAFRSSHVYCVQAFRARGRAMILLRRFSTRTSDDSEERIALLNTAHESKSVRSCVSYTLSIIPKPTNKQKLSSIPESIPTRLNVGLMLFLACFMSYMLRVNMSINILGMVEPGQLNENKTQPDHVPDVSVLIE